MSRSQLPRDSIGRQLAVEHEFVDSERIFRHTARVVEYQPGPPEVVTFEFRAEDHAVRELILCHAEGKSIPYLHRRAERRPVWLPVEIVVGARSRTGIVTELSELGAFVAMQAPPGAGSRTTLRIPAEDGARLAVDLRVVYARTKDGVGFAGELVFADRASEVRIRTALREALQAMKRK